jgi:hypothetical protein
MSMRMGVPFSCASGGSAQPAHSGAARRAGRLTGESAALEVRTADGDTVRISLEARSRVRAGDSGASAESAWAVRVEVNGSLDDQETSQIGDLLQSLVAASRSAPGTDVSAAVPDTDLGTLLGFRYVYQAYERVRSQGAVETGF